MEKVNERIVNLRKDRGLYQKQIAKLLNTNQNTVSNIEKNQRELKIDEVIKLANFFDVSTDYLLCLTDDKRPVEQILIESDISNNTTELKEFIEKALYKTKEDLVTVIKSKKK